MFDIRVVEVKDRKHLYDLQMKLHKGGLVKVPGATGSLKPGNQVFLGYLVEVYEGEEIFFGQYAIVANLSDWSIILRNDAPNASKLWFHRNLNSGADYFDDLRFS